MNCLKYKVSSTCPIIFVLFLWPEISAAKWSKLILDYLYPSKLGGAFKYFFIFTPLFGEDSKFD